MKTMWALKKRSNIRNYYHDAYLFIWGNFNSVKYCFIHNFLMFIHERWVFGIC